jgi:NAD-dependent dihydropyrimidine dehydrogenase PreA subunit
MQTTLFSNRILPTTAVHRWLLAGVLPLALALGWRYRLLGFVVPAAMLGGLLRGRQVCGNLCEQNCPMGYTIAAHKAAGAMHNRDCLQCSTCVNICPVSALELLKPGTGAVDCAALPADKEPSFDQAA